MEAKNVIIFCYWSKPLKQFIFDSDGLNNIYGFGIDDAERRYYSFITLA